MRHAHQTLRRLQYPGWTDAQLAALRVSTVVIVVWYPPAAEAAVPAKGGVRGLEDMTGFHVRSVAEVPRRSTAAAHCGKRLGRVGGGGFPLAGTDSTVGKSAAAGGGRLVRALSPNFGDRDGRRFHRAPRPRRAALAPAEKTARHCPVAQHNAYGRRRPPPVRGRLRRAGRASAAVVQDQ